MKIGIFDKLIYTIELYKCWKTCAGYIPRHIELMITSTCNSRCVMCNVWKLKKERPELEREEVSTQEYINLFKELSAMGTRSIVLSGGEPTLRKDLIILIKNAKDVGFEVELITNGMLITQKMAEEMVNADLDWLSISLDGHTPEIHDPIRGVKGGWQNAVRGIKHIKHAKDSSNRKKPFINISHTVTKTNYRYLSKMIELRSELGYDTLNFNPVIGKVSEAEDLFLSDNDIRVLETELDSLKMEFKNAGIPESKIKPLLRLCKDKTGAKRGKYAESFNNQINCFVPWNMATIDPFGKVYPCCFATPFQNLSDDMEHGFWGDDSFCMGDIKDQSFNQIWDGEKYRRFREACKSPPTFPFCDWCNYRGAGAATLTGLFKDRLLLLKLITGKYGKL